MRAQDNSFLIQQYLRALSSAAQARDLERALAIGAEAVRRGVEHPRLLALAAQKALRQGDAETALPLLERARTLEPRNAEILNDLGLCLVRLGRARDALPCFEASLRHRPGAAMVHFNKAIAHEQLGELDRERAHLERAVECDPAHVQALSLLAMLAADRDDRAAAREYAGRALALSPGEMPARMALASIDIADGRHAEAHENLAAVLRMPALDADNRSLAQTLMGDLLDAQGRFVDAFSCYQASAELQRAHYARAASADPAESFRAQTGRLAREFQAAGSAWSKAQAHDPAARHVFVTGFLRSGTTVLARILAAHDETFVLDERDGLAEAIGAFVVPEGGMLRLAAAGEETLEPFGQSYWRRARALGWEEGRILVDKAPLAAIHLPLLLRLFPRAAIVFAVRDPRDVVISCFRRRFAMTRQKYDLLTLEGAASCYAGAMDLVRTYGERLRPDMLTVRHEELVASFEPQTRRLCDFLGLGFDARMLAFGADARTKNIDTPNSAQLARGLSGESTGHWRHYADQLVPVMPILAPWCAHFGYPEN